MVHLRYNLTISNYQDERKIIKRLFDVPELSEVVVVCGQFADNDQLRSALVVTWAFEVLQL